MTELEPFDSFPITGRGTMFLIRLDTTDKKAAIAYVASLKGQTVSIYQETWEVTGYENQVFREGQIGVLCKRV